MYCTISFSLIPYLENSFLDITYGISNFWINEKDIVQYKAIDAAVTIKRKIDKNINTPFKNNNKKNILIRVEKDKKKIEDAETKNTKEKENVTAS